jgi:hypothetical protein
MLYQQRPIQPPNCLVFESAQFLNFFTEPSKAGNTRSQQKYSGGLRDKSQKPNPDKPEPTGIVF